MRELAFLVDEVLGDLEDAAYGPTDVDGSPTAYPSTDENAVVESSDHFLQELTIQVDCRIDDLSELSRVLRELCDCLTVERELGRQIPFGQLDVWSAEDLADESVADGAGP